MNDEAVSRLGVALPEPSVRADARQQSIGAGRGGLSPLLGAFDDWLLEWQNEPGRWMAFDQFVREQLRTMLGASRVRCFKLVEEELRPLTPARDPFTPTVSAREGIAGYVVARGQRYLRHDELLGPIVHQLAAASTDPPFWCFPVPYEHTLAGLVSVGQVQPGFERDVLLLESLGCVISLLWARLADRERMVIARQTDHSSGVLQRAHLFAAAERALQESYAEHEPVLAMAVALEGLRRLDDHGQWELRDAAVVRAGQAIRRKLRTDDVVGRFSDDRFVAILRRLDTALGRMIAEKLLDAVTPELRAICGEAVNVQVRCGLVGTGQQQPPLSELLSRALAVCDEARAAGARLMDDLAPGARGD